MKSLLVQSIFLMPFLFAASLANAGTISDKPCPFDAPKVNAAVKEKLTQAFLPKIPFWNQQPPTVNCKREEDWIVCKVSFSAADGTQFYMRDNGGAEENVMTIDGFRLDADNEGNYVQPLTCKSYLRSVAYYNKKTKVGWGIGESFETASYVK
jgi:hypothetical protein